MIPTVLGVDSPLLSTIVLFKHWVSGGFLDRRIPGKNGGGTTSLRPLLHLRWIVGKVLSWSRRSPRFSSARRQTKSGLQFKKAAELPKSISTSVSGRNPVLLEVMRPKGDSERERERENERERERFLHNQGPQKLTQHTDSPILPGYANTRFGQILQAGFRAEK